VRVGARECAFHAVRGCGDQMHTNCTSHGGTPGGGAPPCAVRVSTMKGWEQSWSVREHEHAMRCKRSVSPGRCGSSAAYDGVRSLARWQFVMNIDEQLFASFAPRNLKRALAKSAELVAASLPTFHGLDLAPVLKLIAALTMVGCLVGMVIVPQNALLDDARVTLCGSFRVHLLLSSGRLPLCSEFGVRRRVGQLGVGRKQVRQAVLGRPERVGRRLDCHKRPRAAG
jgi:hypothetical protein